jgi:hypothetical protein
MLQGHVWHWSAQSRRIPHGGAQGALMGRRQKLEEVVRRQKLEGVVRIALEQEAAVARVLPREVGEARLTPVEEGVEPHTAPHTRMWFSL